MATKIRLTRIGTKGKPHWRLVVQDERFNTKGRVIEILGSPGKINQERISWWLEHGAQMSEAAKKLVS